MEERQSKEWKNGREVEQRVEKWKRGRARVVNRRGRGKSGRMGEIEQRVKEWKRGRAKSRKIKERQSKS